VSKRLAILRADDSQPRTRRGSSILQGRARKSVGAPSGAINVHKVNRFPASAARPVKGLPTPAACESLSLDWSRESNQGEDHPTTAMGGSSAGNAGANCLQQAPCAQSLCFGYASLLRGSLTAPPCAGSELAHIVWAILRTIPAQPRRQRGTPVGAHCARRSTSHARMVSSIARMKPMGGAYA